MIQDISIYKLILRRETTGHNCGTCKYSSIYEPDKTMIVCNKDVELDGYPAYMPKSEICRSYKSNYSNMHYINEYINRWNELIDTDIIELVNNPDKDTNPIKILFFNIAKMHNFTKKELKKAGIEKNGFYSRDYTIIDGVIPVCSEISHKKPIYK